MFNCSHFIALGETEADEAVGRGSSHYGEAQMKTMRISV